MIAHKRQQLQQQQQLAQQRALAQAQAQAQGQVTINGVNGMGEAVRPPTAIAPDTNSDHARPHGSGEDGATHPQGSPGIAVNGSTTPDGRLSVSAEIRGGNASPAFVVRSPPDHIEEVGQILKTAFPLLIMSLETVVDQIMQRFKSGPEEEIYRLVCMLLQDAVQVNDICLSFVVSSDTFDSNTSIIWATQMMMGRFLWQRSIS